MTEKRRGVVIDCLQYCNYSETIFRELREGGVDAIHATVSYHEDFRATVANIIRWNELFAAHAGLICPGWSGADVRRARSEGRTAVFLGLQNCSSIEDDIGLVEICHRLGIRFMQLSYNNQSLLASGCYESEDAGITRMGREVIAEMNRLGMVVDMSHAVHRVQLTQRCPYAEIRDNLTGADLRPIDILRCKLSFFGATDFDPRSDRWLRVALFRHAPFPDELGLVPPDDWAIPPFTPIRTVEADKADRPASALRPKNFGPEGYSLNEIDGQLRKAARGAGLSWGLAEDVGRMARIMAQSMPKHLDLFAEALEALQDGRHSADLMSDRLGLSSRDGRMLSPLVAGPAIADRSHDLVEGQLAVTSPVAMPALLVPALVGITEWLGRALLLRTHEGEVIIGGNLADNFDMLRSRTSMSGLVVVRPSAIATASRAGRTCRFQRRHRRRPVAALRCAGGTHLCPGIGAVASCRRRCRTQRQ